jgi:hypothetical protein
VVASFTSRIPWPRLGAEAVIIIGSILLALGVDEWREERIDRALEHEYLSRLMEDIEANLSVLEAQRLDDTRKIANARAIYPLVNNGSWGDLDKVTAIVSSYNASPSATPTWVGDTFEELKSTGRLGLIRNSEIRRKLLAYYSFLEARDWPYQLLSTDYRDAVRAKLDPDIQLRIREQCRSREVGCSVTIDISEAEAYLEWLTDNQALADGLRRVIVQWTRGETEFLPGVRNRGIELKGLIDEELAR